MEHVSAQQRDPFNLRPPCNEIHPGNESRPVNGYGDPSADFHIIGDHPALHGGSDTGIPFTDKKASRRLMDVLRDATLIQTTDTDQPYTNNLYMSYIYPCTTPGDRPPRRNEYRKYERYFDAEIRAVNPHILLPVGETPAMHITYHYTNQWPKIQDTSINDLHATEIRGMGFLEIPIKTPSKWSRNDEHKIKQKLIDTLTRDYRQTKGIPSIHG